MSDAGRILTIFLGLSLLLPVLSGKEAAQEADAFFAPLSTVKSLSCRFTQEQKIRGLAHPILLTGRFCMTGKGDLAWIVETPVKFYCVIRGDLLRSWDAESGKERSVDLKDHPAFSLMIDMMKKFFSGKISVTKDYSCTVKDKRTITLIPASHNPLSGNVSRIEITLSPDGKSIASMKTLAVSGDETALSFKETVLDKPIPESIWKEGKVQ